jgi:hypothetical protein
MANALTYDRPVRSTPAFSVPSILAIVCAILSFVTGGWGLFLAIAAIILGLVGVLLALSPRVRGGLMSVFSVLAGLLGIVVALFKVVF